MCESDGDFVEGGAVDIGERGARCFGEDCCGGVSFCEGEGVIGGGVIGGIEIESRGVIDGDDGDGGGGGIGSESVAVVSDDGQNAVAGGGGVLVGVGIAESIEESFCLCGGEFGCVIACEGDGGGA